MMDFTINWKGKMAFGGITPSGHEFILDADPQVGGENGGPRPTELLLQAVTGCTGMDIISILHKMRIEPTSFQMDVTGERAEEHPKRFTAITIHYAFDGDLPEDKVIRAIQLSKDTYCSVSHSLNAEISVSYSINGVKGEKSI